MLSLGIDCSEFGVSVALANDKQLIMEQSTTENKRASQFLVPQIKALFKNTPYKLAQVESIAVAQGPGSFTGLKIGVTAGKVLANVNHAKLFGISSLVNLAFPLLTTGNPVLTLISARHQNFYAGIYQKKSRKIVTLLPDSYLNYSVLREKIKHFNGLLIMGAGLEDVKTDLKEFGIIIPVSSGNLFPRGYSAILLSKGEKSISPDQFVPNYIRDPQAVLAWEKNNPEHSVINYVEEI